MGCCLTRMHKTWEIMVCCWATTGCHSCHSWSVYRTLPYLIELLHFSLCETLMWIYRLPARRLTHNSHWNHNRAFMFAYSKLFNAFNPFNLYIFAERWITIRSKWCYFQKRITCLRGPHATAFYVSTRLVAMISLLFVIHVMTGKITNQRFICAVMVLYVCQSSEGESECGWMKSVW